MISKSSFPKISFWHLIYLMTLVCLGALSHEEFRHMLAASDDDILLVYDAAGRSHLLMPDHLSGHPRPLHAILPYNERKMLELDLCLLKPSCCEAPMGLSHVWFRPNRLGEALSAHAPRPDLAAHPG
jgi:hypothetical protein